MTKLGVPVGGSPLGRRRRLGATWLVLFAIVLTACEGPGPFPSTPAPTTVPTPSPDDAGAVAQAYATAWTSGDYAAMYALLAPGVQARYSAEVFADLHRQLVSLPQTTEISVLAAAPRRIALPPERRPPDLPAPTPFPTATGTGGGTDPAAPSPTAVPTPPPATTGSPAPGATTDPAPAAPEGPVLEGPVLGMEVDVDVTLVTTLFGEQLIERPLVLAQGADGWQVRWTPATLIEGLGDGGTLELTRELAPRGRILASDGSVLAETREDGVRVYPQESLAGQTVGYVTEVTAEDLVSLAPLYQAGDVIGRSGLEAGAEELLRGSPGFTLRAVPATGEPTVVFQTEAVPSADVHTTLRLDVQRAAEAALGRYPSAATAVVDPASGDVWALASTPPLNPNAFTLGGSLSGIELPVPEYTQIANKTVIGRYPAGSSFKPFTLAAALQTGVATPDRLVTCPPTWEYEGFVFQNYEEHELPGQVSLADAMAFSCNTTYMPLGLEVFQADPAAFPTLVRDFGFGERTGIRHLAEEPGIVPDEAYFMETEGRSYGAFDQIQLSIGQGAFLGTPLQLAMAYAALGNGGTLWTPRLVTRAEQPDGEVAVSYEPEARRDVALTDAQLAYVVETLRAVVEREYGTAFVAFSGFEVSVAGKSGTAETSGPDPDSWFAGFAPSDAPTIAVASVLVEEPLSTGGADAGPLVRRVMEAHFAR